MKFRWCAAVVGFVSIAAGLVTVPGSPATAAAVARVDVGDASTVEGDSGSYRFISFPVTLSDPVTSTVTVSYHLMNGTAAAPGDFNDMLGVTKTVTFLAGKGQHKYINVKVNPDTAVEGDETMQVMVLSVAGADQGTTTATGTIVDDDPTNGLTAAVSDASISEGDSGKNRVAKFWVNLSAPATAAVTVHAMTMDAEATGGSDYTTKMKDIAFAPGQYRKPFTVTVVPDTLGETDEMLHVMLSVVSGTVSIPNDTGMGTIVNDDASSFTTESFTTGPFNLTALGGAASENEASGILGRPAGSFAIKSMTFDLVDQNGVSIDLHAVHLHHIVFLDWSQPDAVCPSYPSRFTGAGKEKTPFSMGGDYGYKVEAADPAWTGSWHVMNMSAQARTVFIKWTVSYVPYSSPLAARNVTPYWYDVTGPCTNSEFNVPGTGGSGSIYTKTRTFTAPRAGTRIGVGGHLHDGGIDIAMKRTANNQLICNNVADYPMPGMLHSISYCNNETTVAAGEQFTTTARYDNGAAVPGAMGIQVNYVWEG